MISADFDVRLLTFVFDDARRIAEGRIPYDHMQSLDMRSAEVLAALKASAADVEAAVGRLIGKGFLRLSAMGLSVEITAAGMHFVTQSQNLASAVGKKWISRTPALEWQLANPKPLTVAEIRDAMSQTTQIMSNSGPGAPSYEQGASILKLLEVDLGIALSRERPTTSHQITIGGDVHGAQFAQGTQHTNQAIAPRGITEMTDHNAAEAADIHDRQVKRFEVLKFLYRDAGHLQDGQIQSVSAGVIQGAVGITPAERSQIEDYLSKRGLIEIVAMGPELAITTRGIDYVEAALTQPERPTEYFPPASTLVLNVHGGIHGSQIQQGTSHSVQHANVSTIDVTALLGLLDRVRTAAADVMIGGPQRAELVADLATIEAQAKSSNPKRSMMSESLTSARNILEGAAGSMLAAQLPSLLVQLAQLIK
jgi:hypothetical protein